MKLFEKVAEQLERHLSAVQSPSLPSLDKLSIHFGVSRLTMSRAARLLEKKGLLDISRGRRISIIRSQQREISPPSLPSVQLTNDLENQILNGIIKAGQMLPKSAYLMMKYRLSSQTLVRCLRNLRMKGMVDKKGRHWIAGSAGTPAGRKLTAKYVIYLLQEELFLSPTMIGERSNRFFQSFFQEAYDRDIQLLPLVTSQGQSDVNVPGNERNVIRAAVRDAGHRYLGTLLAGSKRQFPHLQNWLRTLDSFGKPVVWFDRYNEGFATGSSCPPCIRCYFEERGAIETAIRFLLDSGHRSLGFYGHEFQPWIIRRLSLIKSVLADYAPGMKISVEYVPDKTVSGEFETLKDSSAQPEDTSIQMRDNALTALLTKMLHERVTAVIAADDYAAQQIYGHCALAGLSVPGDFSIVSFDNIMLRFPVTSVDFGFGYLGYAAFHAILGDIPLRRERNGEIKAQARVIDKGSVSNMQQSASRAGRGRTK